MNREPTDRELAFKAWLSKFINSVLIALLVSVIVYQMQGIIFKSVAPEELKQFYEYKTEYEIHYPDVAKQIEEEYPKVPLFITYLFEKYDEVKKEAFIAYATPFVLMLIAFVFLKKKLKEGREFVFPKPVIEPPLELGEFIDFVDFDVIGIKKKDFVNLFRSELDYITFCRIVDNSAQELTRNREKQKEIAEKVKNLIDELENWAKINGFKIKDLKHFRLIITLVLYHFIINLFVRKEAIPSGLINKYLKDEIAKYVLSSYSRGFTLAIKDPQEFWEQVHYYLTTINSFRIFNKKEHTFEDIYTYLRKKYDQVYKETGTVV